MGKVPAVVDELKAVTQQILSSAQLGWPQDAVVATPHDPQVLRQKGLAAASESSAAGEARQGRPPPGSEVMQCGHLLLCRPHRRPWFSECLAAEPAADPGTGEKPDTELIQTAWQGHGYAHEARRHQQQEAPMEATGHPSRFGLPRARDGTGHVHKMIEEALGSVRCLPDSEA